MAQGGGYEGGLGISFAGPGSNFGAALLAFGGVQGAASFGWSGTESGGRLRSFDAGSESGGRLREGDGGSKRGGRLREGKRGGLLREGDGAGELDGERGEGHPCSSSSSVGEPGDGSRGSCV